MKRKVNHTRRQLPLPVERHRQPDRHHAHGGRSFYFFDFDDNVMFLPTMIYLFHRETGDEVAVSTGRFAEIQHQLGAPGPWYDYAIDPDDQSGSFRGFRDDPRSHDIDGQSFVKDLRRAIVSDHHEWAGPSWDIFDYATHNERPVSIITARGHHPDTIKAGVELLREAGHISRAPNFVGIYPVSNAAIRRDLSADGSLSVPELKKQAIVRCVEEAFRAYGDNPYHRFGMSDDDPQNLYLISEAMRSLKARYPDNGFFVIDTSDAEVRKSEIFVDHTETVLASLGEQLSLFD